MRIDTTTHTLQDACCETAAEMFLSHGLDYYYVNDEGPWLSIETCSSTENHNGKIVWQISYCPFCGKKIELRDEKK